MIAEHCQRHPADDRIDRLLASLENGALADNTIVVLWADHGYHLEQKQHWEKFALWEHFLFGGDKEYLAQRSYPIMKEAAVFFHARAIHLLPALPSALPEGRVTDLRARGAFEVDLAWSGGKLESAVIRSLNSGPCEGEHGEELIEFDTASGQEIHLDGVLSLSMGSYTSSPSRLREGRTR